jgi:hypothetical protein
LTSPWHYIFRAGVIPALSAQKFLLCDMTNSVSRFIHLLLAIPNAVHPFYDVERLVFVIWFGFIFLGFLYLNIIRCCGRRRVGKVFVLFHVTGLLSSCLLGVGHIDAHGYFGIFLYVSGSVLLANGLTILYAALIGYIYIAVNAIDVFSKNLKRNTIGATVLIGIHIIVTNVSAVLVALTDKL